MFDSLLLSINIVFPLFLMMAAGFVLRRALKLDEGWVQATNKVVFRCLLPLLLMRNMVESDLSQALSVPMLRLIAYGLGAVALTFVALYLLVPRFERENPRRGVLVQGIYRANTALFGIPVALAMYGQGGIGTVTLLICVGIPLFNVLAVLSLKLFDDCKPGLGGILKDIVTNPLIIGIAAGLLLNLTGLKLPAILQKPVWTLADCATPVSFLTLGASFSFASAAKDRHALTWATLARLIFVPFVWLLPAVALGFRSQPLFALMMLFTPPTAVSSYPMACAMKGDGKLASEIVVFTSAFSILSLFLWVFTFRTLGWI